MTKLESSADRRSSDCHDLAKVLVDFVTKIGFPTTSAAGIEDNDSIQIWHVEQP